MRLLVVDDDIYSAAGIKAALSDNMPEIDAILTAQNVEEAERVFLSEPPDILITDIEMPGGSGFMLLKWLKDSGFDPVIIMLTSYAVFDYAKKALEYHCHEYLLKPVARDALERAVSSAAEAVLRKEDQSRNLRLAQYWNSSENWRVVQLIRGILDNALSDDAGLAAALEDAQVTLSGESRYMPILFSLGHGTAWNESLRADILSGIFYNSDRIAGLLYDGYYLCVVAGDYGFDRLREHILDEAAAFVKERSDGKDISLCACAGSFVPLEGLHAEYSRIRKRIRNNVTESAGLLMPEDMPGDTDYTAPDMDRFMQLFMMDDYRGCAVLMDDYMDMQAAGRHLNLDKLYRILHDYMQTFYIALNRKGLPANRTRELEQDPLFYQTRAENVHNLKAWFHTSLDWAASQNLAISDEQALVSKVRQYIDEHLSEELGRDELAAQFYLSPDHFSKVFHHQTGTKLVDYISARRMEEAARLLRTTDRPIGEIAGLVGYSSSSYFSRVFRIHYRVTPVQYREET